MAETQIPEGYEPGADRAGEPERLRRLQERRAEAAERLSAFEELADKPGGKLLLESDEVKMLGSMLEFWDLAITTEILRLERDAVLSAMLRRDGSNFSTH